MCNFAFGSTDSEGSTEVKDRDGVDCLASKRKKKRMYLKTTKKKEEKENEKE